MTTPELITRAEHALRTGQPNLATLYMRNALEHAAAARAQDAKDYRAAQTKLRAHRMNRSLSGFFTGLGEIAAEAFQWVADAVEFTPSTYQADYTLAGPSKGTS